MLFHGSTLAWAGPPQTREPDQASTTRLTLSELFFFLFFLRRPINARANECLDSLALQNIEKP